MKTYRINEIFYSLQGEGARAGEPSVFVRFAGCNLRCAMLPGDRSPGGFDCDTEFESGRALDEIALIGEIVRIAGGCRWIVFTGGEPGLQLDEGLIAAVRRYEFLSAIETNGTIALDHLGLDWITVSPKVAEHALVQRKADEVKYVRHFGQSIPRTMVDAKFKYLSPAFGPDGLDPKILNWCIELVKANPEWRLSVQQHKLWGVR